MGEIFARTLNRHDLLVRGPVGAKIHEPDVVEQVDGRHVTSVPVERHNDGTVIEEAMRIRPLQE